MVSVVMDGVTKVFPEGPALSGVTLRVEEGESVVLLGPSGCGKTTLLRLLAGLDAPSTGEILFDGFDVTDLGPVDRNIAMFFQDNTLYPTMTGGENIGFPLRVRRTPEPEMTHRIQAEARALGIMEMLEKHPSKMSAGQQHLVQLARALVRRPSLFLIDEPFAMVDAAKRAQLRTELRSLQSGYGATALYATHDQEDAMTLGDKLAVLDQGRLRQLGTPSEVYLRPTDTFVAQFVGSPEMALLDGAVSDGTVTVAGLRLRAGRDLPRAVLVGVRPEDWRPATTGIEARVTRIHDLGGHTLAEASTETGPITVRSDLRFDVGDVLHLKPTRFALFDPRSGKAIFHSRPS